MVPQEGGLIRGTESQYVLSNIFKGGVGRYEDGEIFTVVDGAVEVQSFHKPNKCSQIGCKGCGGYITWQGEEVIAEPYTTPMEIGLIIQRSILSKSTEDCSMITMSLNFDTLPAGHICIGTRSQSGWKEAIAFECCPYTVCDDVIRLTTTHEH